MGIRDLPIATDVMRSSIWGSDLQELQVLAPRAIKLTRGAREREIQQQQQSPNGFDAKQMYDNLEESGMDHDRILAMLKSWNIEYKPKTIASADTLTSSAAAIAKLDGQLSSIDNNLRGAHSKHEKLVKQLEQCEDDMAKLVSQKKDLHMQKQRLYDNTATATSAARVANAMAAQLGDDTVKLFAEFEEQVVSSVPEAQQNALLLTNMNLMQAAQIEVQRHMLEKEEVRKERDAILERLQRVEQAVEAAARERAKAAASCEPRQTSSYNCSAPGGINSAPPTPQPAAGLVTGGSQVDDDEEDPLQLGTNLDNAPLAMEVSDKKRIDHPAFEDINEDEKRLEKCIRASKKFKDSHAAPSIVSKNPFGPVAESDAGTVITADN